ncbi:transglycosylase SLT domain-containing protein [Sansalvadorimonas verongulae]|uniref:transglycosylase SLT domain-containing protein n=1 Tax=Sansalvadorimonas verongulae TaxID=2172824 RepID=UPI0018AD18BE|nr:transglycosylase SLT domain-containing protein [Sansalvadorimonas verongulae]
MKAPFCFISRVVGLFVLSTSFSSVASINLPSSPSNISEQRTLFQQVELSLESGSNTLYQQHKETLDEYPLAGHLEYLFLKNRLSHISQQDIDTFVADNPRLPQSSRIQYKWLGWLARKQRWQAYLQAYNRLEKQPGVRYQCLQGRALLATGNQSAAWQRAQNLWLVGKSQNKACDPLFHQWKKAGQLTQSLASQRFWLAVANGKTSLARYIDRSITQPFYKDDTQLFWRVYRNPALLKKASLLDGTQAKHRQIMVYGVKRQIPHNHDKALDLWLTLRDKHPFAPDVRGNLDKRLALRFAKRFTEHAEEQIARIDPEYKYTDVTKWRVRLALEQQDWESVKRNIQQLPEAEQQHASWSYWQEVANIKLSPSSLLVPPEKEVSGTLDRLRQERSFYGFLVADLTGKPFQLNHQSARHSQAELNQLMARHNGFARIKEWLALDRMVQVQSELNRIKPRLTVQERRLLPYLAHQLGWHHQAIMAAAREAMWNDLDVRFPSPQEHLFSHYAQKRGIDYSWVVSIARQESAFNPAAHSHAGARGLMQLIPSTARQAARQKQIPFKKASELYKPETNIALGTAHLEWLTRQFEDNRVFATAAYNAGGSAVRRWLRARGHLPLDVWIETIPYDETRRYVKNVLAFRVIYSLREQGEATMFSPDESMRLALTPAEKTLIASYP